MLTPPRALPPNPHIAILAPSGPSDPDRIAEGVRRLEARGCKVTIAENVGHRHRGYLAGDDEERVTILNRFLRDPQYDAFFFARGGYGAMRLLDRVDYQAIIDDPRPIVGFSDITALHQAIAVHAGVASFHGPMINSDFVEGLSPDIDAWCWSVLAGEAPLTWQLGEENILIDGEAEGPLFGGCLSLTTSLTGTPHDFWIDGGIWFWEDIEEPVYRIDRMLTHLGLSGRMAGIRGVVIGNLKGCGDETERSRLLREFFQPFGIPVVQGLSFGHHGNNLLLPIGTAARLSARDRSLVLVEPAVLR